MSEHLDRDRADTDLEEQLRGVFHATRVPRAPTTIRDRVSDLLASEPSVSGRRTWSRVAAAWLPAAALVVAVGLVGAALFVGARPGPSSSPGSSGSSTPSSPAQVGPIAHYSGDGWGFDYPSTWTFYPFQTTSSFFGSIGYLASIPVDTSKICTRSNDSVSCDLHGYDIRPGNVVVELAHAGTPMGDPVQFYDHPEHGTRVMVGGMPAVFGEERVSADHVRLAWKIARPDAFGNWIQVDADILGPGDDQLRQQVETLISSFDFVPAPMPLATGQEAANAIAARAIANLQAREPAAYECFPSKPGTTKVATVTALPSATLTKPLPVQCSITINRTDVGFWRLELVSSWDAAADRMAGTDTTVQWLFPDGAASASTGSVAGAIPYCCK